MNALHNLVISGKVLYLGVSDTPAWVVADANRYAIDHGKSPFVIYQGRWNVLSRDFEREIIPMARHLGLALAPWDVLARGKIRTDAEEDARRQTGERGRDLWGQGWERNENEKKMAVALEAIATEVGAKSIQAGVFDWMSSVVLRAKPLIVAIAYVLQRTPYVFPIIGGRKIEHLHANIEALEVVLTKEHIKQIESVVPFDYGFPHNLFVCARVQLDCIFTYMLAQGREDDEQINPVMFIGGHFDRWPLQQAILPKKD